MHCPGSTEFRANLVPQAAEFRDGGGMFFRRVDGAGRPAGRHEDAGQRVVVGLGDRIEFMIVAASTGDGHSQKGLGEGVDLVVDHFLVDAVEVETRPMTVFAHVVEHRPDETLDHSAFRIHARLGQEIARKLLANQLIKADVGIEGSNQIVPVFPGSFGRIVPLVAVGVGVPHHVHPVSGKAFSVMGRGEELID
jgi:hypothetical protein